MDLQIDIQWVLSWSVRIPSSYRLKMLEIACQLARKVTMLPLHLCRVVFHQGKWFMIINTPEFSSIKQTKNAKEMTCLCRKQDDLPVKWVQDDMPWRAPRPVVRSRSVKVSTVEAGNCADRWMVDKQKPSNTDNFCLRYEEIAVSITLLIEKKVYLYICYCMCYFYPTYF